LDAGGFTMVVLLVVMAIMAVGTAALLPTWRQQMIREHEEELIFRGNQLARALVLYARKNNNVLPANIDVLYEGKYLRKKYKDPITGEDFGLMGPGQIPGAAGRGAPGTGRASTPGPTSGRGSTPGSTSGRGMQIVGSIQGFYSTSTDNSIKLYQNQSRYIDWPFTVQTAQALMGLPFGRRGGGPFGGDQGRQGGPTRGGGPVGGRGGGPVGGPGGRGGIQPPGRTGGGQPPAAPPVIRRGGGGGL
jgi:type II secretory pathway pseudopilin PulG